MRVLSNRFFLPLRTAVVAWWCIDVYCNANNIATHACNNNIILVLIFEWLFANFPGGHRRRSARDSWRHVFHKTKSINSFFAALRRTKLLRNGMSCVCVCICVCVCAWVRVWVGFLLSSRLQRVGGLTI